MGATATAPRTSRRKAADRRSAGRAGGAARASAKPRAAKRSVRASRQATPIPGRLVPLAVGRTAGAVGGLADSGLVVRLTRGQLWIGALAALLIGIVALNVVALGFTASSSDTARSVEELTRRGSELRAQIAKEHSNERVQRVASTLGLVVPEPGAIRYLRPSDDDALEAARRLRSGELTIALTPAPVVSEVDGALAPAEPVVDPAAEPAVEAPAPAVEAPAESSPSPPSAPEGGSGAGGAPGGVSGGGVAAP